MKTIIVFLISAMSLTTLQASEPEVRFPDNINKHVGNINIYPEVAIKNNIQGFVDIVFEVTKEGTLEVSEYFGTDPLLSEYVITSLADVKMCPFDLSVGKKYKVRYSFQLI